MVGLDRVDGQRWQAVVAAAREHLRQAQQLIDEASRYTEDAEVDQKLCYAGNTLQGALALLREADAAHRQLDVEVRP